jgi:O-antigen/teichoic acid export membrane protein
MGLAFIPLYIKFLGIEAYGLIGLFALLQAWLAILDMGMTPTLVREMARHTADTHDSNSIRDLLRSIEVVAICIAALAFAGIALGADWMASSWLNAETLSNEVVSQAIQAMALIIAVRFIEGIYRGSIVGLQRQVLLNTVNAAMSTLRGFGALGVLVWVSASIEAFFIWQALVSIATAIIYAVATYTCLPRGERAGHFSLAALTTVWRFAGGMFSISVLSLMLMQVDKLLLSNLLSLSEFGFYTLAAVVAGSLFMVITPITQAYYPVFCNLQARQDQARLIESYHKSAQLIAVFAGSIAMVVIVHSETLLRLWTQDPELAKQTAPLLSLLMLGNLLNGLMWIPYHAQLAHGWTSLTIRINVVAVTFLIPTVIWAITYFGALGSASVWVTLNAGYVFIGIHFMHRRILVNEKWRWYIQDNLIPLLVGGAAVTSFDALWSTGSNDLSDIIKLTILTILTPAAMFITIRVQRSLE